MCPQRGGAGALGLGGVIARDPGKGGEQKPPAELSEPQLRTTRQSKSGCTVGGLCVRMVL